LAEVLIPWATEKFSQVYSSDTNTCRSQGWGALRYAQKAAEGCADRLRAQGIEAEVRSATETWGTRFEVWAKTDEAGFDLIDRKGETIKDFLKRCWKAGVNPRVYNPFIPAGLEEKLGLDYFGNEK